MLPERPLDLLLTHATLLTADPAQPCLRGASVGILDGRIAYLTATDSPKPTALREIRLDGQLVTPGFVNVHTHCILTMVRGVAADLGFAPSYTPGIPQASQINDEQAYALAQLGALEALLAGSTLVGDHFTHADVATQAISELGMRVAQSWRILDVDFDRVARDGVWSHDLQKGEALLARTLALHERWRHHPRVHPHLAAHAADTCSDALLTLVARTAAQHGLRVNTHLGQSQSEVQRVHARTGLTSTQVLDRAGLVNDRLIAGHCIYVDPVDMQRLAAAGVHVAHIPKCNAASGRIAPTPALRRAGLRLCLATDTQHGDMIEVMRWALASARILEGGIDEDWQPADVFHMATQGGADALGLGDEIGSLAVGKAADLVVFDHHRPNLVPLINPVGTLVHTAQGRDVSMVIVAGDIVVEGGRTVGVDMEAICTRAEGVIQELWAAARV